MNNLDQELYDVLNVHQPTGCAGGHCWGVDKLKTIITTQRQELLSEIEELIATNQKGQFEDEVGNICWYLDDLLSIITTKREEV